MSWTIYMNYTFVAVVLETLINTEFISLLTLIDY